MKENVRSVLEMVYEHSLTQPDRIAAGDKDKSLTYRQLYEAACRGAAWLESQGVRRGDILVLPGLQKTEYIVTLFAAHLAGAIACPIEKAVRAERAAQITDMFTAAVFFSEKPLKGVPFKNLLYKDLWAFASDISSELPSYPFPEEDTLSEILFTTGTTGRSKGIKVTFATNISIAQNVIDSVSMGPDETELITSPVNHSLAMRRIYGGLYNGSTVLLTEGFKFARTFFGILDQYQVTALTLVPAILEQILVSDRDHFASYNRQLNYLQFGSAPLSETNKQILLEMFPDVRLYNTYGATESGCTIILEFSRYRDKKNCIGRTTVNTRLLLVDQDRKEKKASPQDPGYFAFAGGMNMSGYYGDPAETEKAMDEQGIIYTNDIGYIGEDGLVYLIGREGDVINMGGIKIAPTEIEETAMRHPMVRDCACIPVPDPITGQAAKLFVEPEDGYELDVKALRTFLTDQLEAIKVPKQYEQIDKIPRTFNGKIIRKELKGR